jgi:hypothetical protein
MKTTGMVKFLPWQVSLYYLQLGECSWSRLATGGSQMMVVRPVHVIGSWASAFGVDWH